MTTTDVLITVVLVLAVWAVVGFYVIRHAVSAGILDADRKREQAAAERALVTRQTQQQL